jgi:hypothetical protein
MVFDFFKVKSPIIGDKQNEKHGEQSIMVDSRKCENKQDSVHGNIHL